MSELVHGIVSLDPPTVRCDGCELEESGLLIVIARSIRFNTRAMTRGDYRRLCEDCRREAGWYE